MNSSEVPLIAEIKDFLPNALLVVDALMKSPNWNYFSGQNFGEMTHDNITDLDESIQKIESTIGSRVSWDENITQGDFRLSKAEQNAARKTLIHYDADYITAILALSTTPQVGTTFYRHKATGYLQARQHADWSWMDAEVGKETWNLDAWEVVGRLPHEFNSLYIFDGNYFHSGPETLTDGRLTQNFWFKLEQKVL